MANGLAKRLYAANFLSDAGDIRMKEITDRFARLEELNQRTSKKAFHISIGAFGKPLSQEQYIQMGKEYMEGMGLARQPYLIYQHSDTGSDHLHIVVSRIAPAGQAVRIDAHPSRLSYRTLEILRGKYELPKFQPCSRELIPLQIEPVSITYAKVPSTKAIREVLSHVLPNYNYTSLDELNAILLQYNVSADRGRPGSLLHESGGLVYQIVDENGVPKGGRVPSSSLPSRPGIKWLQDRFAINHTNVEFALHTRIPLALATARSWDHFTKKLTSNRIAAKPYMNAEGKIYQTIFIDHHDKIAASAQRLGISEEMNVFLERSGIPMTRELSIPMTPIDGSRAERILTKEIKSPSLVIPKPKKIDFL